VDQPVQKLPLCHHVQFILQDISGRWQVHINIQLNEQLQLLGSRTVKRMGFI
jgi:hypothetical protein